ncbi:phosphatase 6 regulatory subunit 1-like protein fmt [Aphomia sociella]
MFWSGNYIVVRQLSTLLKEENVSLTQVLEADDILQECKADNKNLMLFLTKPEILAELITLITEEPPHSVELTAQYRHASVACEVLTSQLSMLSERLSLDVTQMNRLCDFLNKDPPLNPLLASYFSKTVEMLLERSPKQDWYLYHIVCLRVLDFFKSRRDFLPNLLRHISTSAIADTFKYFIRLDDLFNKIIMEWLEEHQFLECLIHIMCGTYVPEEVDRGQQDASEEGQDTNHAADDAERKHSLHTQQESNTNGNGTDKPTEYNEVQLTKEAEGGGSSPERTSAGEVEGATRAGDAELRRTRLQAVASANAAALLCDLILNGCVGEGCNTRSRSSWALSARLQSERCVRLVLRSMFTSAGGARRHALVHGCRLLLALLRHEPLEPQPLGDARRAAELALAPHLPLLHQALLQPPPAPRPAPPPAPPAAGLARVQAAALLAQLAHAHVDDVHTALLTLGTAGVLADMFFSYPQNNFLHAQVFALVANALANPLYRDRYIEHLLVECDLLNRFMDLFEDTENKTAGANRGYALLSLEQCARALEPLAEPELRRRLGAARADRWAAFREGILHPLLQQRDTPLGGYYPSENIYEGDNMADPLMDEYDYNDATSNASLGGMEDGMNTDDMSKMLSGVTDGGDFGADALSLHDDDKMESAKNNFLELANQRFDDDTWEDTPGPDLEEADDAEEARRRMREVLGEASRTMGERGGCGRGGGGGWAQFDAFAPAAAAFDPYWPAPAPAAAPAADPAAHTGTPPAATLDPFWPAPAPAAAPAADPAAAPAADPAAHTEDRRQEDNLEKSMQGLQLDGELQKPLDEASTVELANNLLTAMSGMAPDVVANIVNANIPTAADVLIDCDVHDNKSENATGNDATNVRSFGTSPSIDNAPSVESAPTVDKVPSVESPPLSTMPPATKLPLLIMPLAWNPPLVWTMPPALTTVAKADRLRRIGRGRRRCGLIRFHIPPTSPAATDSTGEVCRRADGLFYTLLCIKHTRARMKCFVF